MTFRREDDKKIYFVIIEETDEFYAVRRDERTKKDYKFTLSDKYYIKENANDVKKYKKALKKIKETYTEIIEEQELITDGTDTEEEVQPQE